MALVLGLETVAPADYGPLQTTNRFPLHMLVLTPRPTNARLPGQGNLDATLAVEYSSTFYEYRNARWDLLVDMELLVTELSMAYGVTEKLAVRLDVPMLSMRDGFLDGFLQNYHDFLGVPNYDRENRPADTFAFRASKDGRLWIEGQSDAGCMGDMRLSAQFALTPVILGGYPVTSTVLATLKLPTGDARSGMGSGQFDAGLFLPMQWNRLRWSLYLMPGFLWINDPQTLGAEVSARDSWSLFGGFAYTYNDKWRWLAQVNYYSSPFEESGLNELDAGALELALGFQRSLNEAIYLEFAFCEDLTRTVPDFNMRLGLTWRFGNAAEKLEGRHP